MTQKTTRASKEAEKLTAVLQEQDAGARKELSSFKTKIETSVPLHVFIARRMDELNDAGVRLTNQIVATALGYPRPNVVTMMRNGSMRVPTNKIIPLASVLRLDPMSLLRRVLREYSPEIWDAIETVLGTDALSENERKLVLKIREFSAGEDHDYTGHAPFLDSLRHMLSEINDQEAIHDLSKSLDSNPSIAGGRQARLNAQMERLLLRQAEERSALRAKLASEQPQITRAA